MINWDDIRFFSRKEFQDPNYGGHSGDLINPITVLLLDHLRSQTGWAIITSWRNGGCVDVDGSWGHSDNSRHLKKNGCEAVDFYFADPETKKPLQVNSRIQYFEVEKMRFGGLGVYYDQVVSGKLLSIGFHVDTRPFSRIQRWKRVDGVYSFLLE